MRSTSTHKAIGLCVLLTVVMAVSAGNAQAAPEWMEAGVNIVGAAQSAEIKTTLENGSGSLLTTISGLAIRVTCTAMSVSGIKLTAGGNTTNGKATFTGCEIYKNSNGEPLECAVRTVAQPGGKIVTRNIHGDIVLHEGGKPVSLIKVGEIVEPERFATLLTEGCTLPEVIPVFGGLEAEDCENRYEEERLTHLLKEEPALTHMYVISDTAEHKATVDGSANVFLANDANWRGLAG